MTRRRLRLSQTTVDHEDVLARRQLHSVVARVERLAVHCAQDQCQRRARVEAVIACDHGNFIALQFRVIVSA